MASMRRSLHSLVALAGLVACVWSTCPVPECMCIAKNVVCTSHHLKMVPVFHPDAVVYEKVAINKNNITNLPPRAFWNIKTRWLDLSHNPIQRGISASTFTRLEPYLHYLDMSYTHIPHLPRELFGRFSELRHLNLWHTNLTKLDAGTFEGLTSLRSLQISHMRCRNLAAGVFRSLYNLDEITIGPGKIGHIERGVFHDTPRLRKLRVFGNRIKTLTAASFTGLSSLHFLNMNNNRISQIETGAFVGLHNLRQVSLAHNELKTIYPGMFKGLDRLQQLHLFNNAITTITDYAMYELPFIRFLWLGENKIASVGNGCGMRRLRRLRKIWLNGNPVTCDCGMSWLDELMQKRVAIYGTCGGPDDLRGLYLTDIQMDHCHGTSSQCHPYHLLRLIRNGYF